MKSILILAAIISMAFSSRSQTVSGNISVTVSNNSVGYFTINDEANQNYQIQESYDLKNWHTIVNSHLSASTNDTVAVYLGTVSVPPVGFPIFGPITNAQAFYRYQKLLGPQFSLSAPTIQSQTVSMDEQGNETVQYVGDYSIHVFAAGGDITFGVENSTRPMFGYNPNVSVGIYKNGVNTPSSAYAPIEVVYPYVPGIISAPTNTIPSADGTSFTLPRNKSTDMLVLFAFTVVNPGADEYAIQIEDIDWTSSVAGLQGPTTSMSTDASWRTVNY